MNAAVNNKKINLTKPLYPYIGVYNNQSYVLFIAPNTGFQLAYTGEPYYDPELDDVITPEIGTYSDKYSEEEFKYFKGSIVLSND